MMVWEITCIHVVVQGTYHWYSFRVGKQALGTECRGHVTVDVSAASDTPP
jgi:hypothetical protein